MPALSANRPADFDQYWQRTLGELAKLPAAPEVEPLPLRSTEFAAAYAIRLTSIGPYRIFGYLSVPHGAGPFPVRYYLPRYGSVVEVIPSGLSNDLRREHITLALGVRGQRNADQPFAASFPGLLTQSIDDPATYVFRGMVADCCRGLEYLMSRQDVDPTRVAAIGGDLAFITAALSSQVTHLVATAALFYATSDLASRTQAYPLEEINDYLRSAPSKRETAARSLSYLDLRWFADRVRARTLLTVGADGELLDAETLRPLLSSLEGRVEVHKTEHSGYKDGLAVEDWVARQFGLGQPVLPEAWR